MIKSVLKSSIRVNIFLWTKHNLIIVHSENPGAEKLKTNVPFLQKSSHLTTTLEEVNI